MLHWLDEFDSYERRGETDSFYNSCAHFSYLAKNVKEIDTCLIR